MLLVQLLRLQLVLAVVAFVVVLLEVVLTGGSAVVIVSSLLHYYQTRDFISGKSRAAGKPRRRERGGSLIGYNLFLIGKIIN